MFGLSGFILPVLAALLVIPATIFIVVFITFFEFQPGTKMTNYFPRPRTKTTKLKPDPQDDDDTQELHTSFQNATQLFLLNPNLISNSDKLQLYALFKQATTETTAPMSWQLLTNPRARSWYFLRLRGISPLEAKRRYLELYKTLQDKEAQLLTTQNYKGGRHKLNENYDKYNFQPILYPGHIIIPLHQLPPSFLFEYNSRVKSKYMAAGRGKSAWDLKAVQDPRPISDAHFVQIFTETHFSKLVHCFRDLDKQAVLSYKDLFKSMDEFKEDDEDTKYFILDTTPIQILPLKVENNAVLCPGVVLFKKIKDVKLDLVGIAIENLHTTIDKPLPSFPAVLKSLRVLRPDDGVAWELAKIHVAAASNYISSLCIHPLLHVALSGPISLTCDALAAIKKPKNAIKNPSSIIQRILSIHSYAQSAVDANAFDFQESVVWADKFPYYPWLVDTSLGGVYTMTKLICDRDWNGHPIYGGRKGQDLTQMEPNYDDVLPFRKFVNSLFPPIQKFVRNVLQSLLENGNKELLFCQTFLHHLLHNLPLQSPWREEIMAISISGQSVEESKKSIRLIMTKLLTYFIFNAFEHSMDHFMLEAPLLRDIQVLIRKPVDFENKSKNYADILTAVGSINSQSDRSKYYLMSHMFFHPHVSKSFNDFFVKGGGYFEELLEKDGFFGVSHKKLQILKSYEQEFVNEIVLAFNERKTLPPFLTLDDIGISVQS